MSIWLVSKSEEYDGYNGREWSYEDAENVAARGYFTSREAADAWVAVDKQRIIDEARAKDEAELARKNAENSRGHAGSVKRDEVRRAEYDAIVEAGLTPSFSRPTERVGFTPQVSKFDEKVCLRGLSWEVVEVEENSD